MEIKTHRRSDGSSFCMMLFGQTKIGKSTFAAHCHSEGGRTLILAAEDGFQYLEDVDVAVPKTWADVQKFTRMKELANYDTVVVDGTAQLVDLAMDAICQKYGTSHPSLDEDKSPMIYSMLSKEVSAFVLLLKRAANNVVFTAHARPGTVAVNENFTETRQMPDMSAGVRRKLLGHCDFVAYMGQKGKSRTLQLNPKRGVEAGGRRSLFAEDAVDLGTSEERTAEVARDFFLRATGALVKS